MSLSRTHSVSEKIWPLLGFALCELLSAVCCAHRTMASSAYANVRAAIADGGSDARVEVNQRALIDKVREKGWINKYLKCMVSLSQSLCVLSLCCIAILLLLDSSSICIMQRSLQRINTKFQWCRGNYCWNYNHNFIFFIIIRRWKRNYWCFFE